MKYKKINKTQARKLFYCGHTLYLLPSKVIFVEPHTETNAWIKPIEISLFNNKEDFDKLVNYFEYYNCNSELGLYTHFYVSEEEIENFKMCEVMCN